ncbi:NAD(P)/FAD-dependent oxidoreductase [Massilia atriviolacea]|uniref:NAD(P)/FAD-dependent oxidoreductase n=1 Tax=Massilia atriviolacea TaxID=2495579 RepID=A0A430HKZ6_9BURK|nr:NAD(P)-binding domain-containing protein [Massilia atriviolacea]RSZ58169.1 NAD(P)/FAD-dependent oxidoreductase [Massilia atriviolacea]
MSAALPTFADLAARVAGGVMSRPRIAIIGAGSSGMAAAAEMLQRGLDPVLFEARSEPGGLWGKDPLSAVYPDLVQSAAAQLPLSHPGSASWAAYTEQCLDTIKRQGLASRIFTSTKVLCVTPSLHAGGAELLIASADQAAAPLLRHFEHVVYAGGLYHTPRMPELAGAASFGGRIVHSSDVRDLSRFVGQKVLIIGLGNTAMECAAKLFPVAQQLVLSGRSPTWLVPRLIYGSPIDVATRALKDSFRHSYQARLWDACREHGAVGHAVDPSSHEIDIGRQRITVSDSMLGPVRSGMVPLRPAVLDVGQHSVHFADGSSCEADVIVCCTGYRSQGILAEGSEEPQQLVGNVLHARYPGLWFTGAPALWGSPAPIAKKQGRLIAHAIAMGWRRDELAQAVRPYVNYDKAAIRLPFGFDVADFNGYAHMVDQASADPGGAHALVAGDPVDYAG